MYTYCLLWKISERQDIRTEGRSLTQWRTPPSCLEKEAQASRAPRDRRGQVCAAPPHLSQGPDALGAGQRGEAKGRAFLWVLCVLEGRPAAATASERHREEGRGAFKAEITHQQAQCTRPHPHASQSSRGPQKASSFDLLLLNFLCCYYYPLSPNSIIRYLN